jgi:hypothetical protein
MSNLVQWSAIVAFFIPILLSLLNQAKFSKELKAVIFFAVSLVAAGGTAYFQGDLTGRRWLDSALVIVPAAAAFYHGFWKPSSIAPKLEEISNFGGGGEPTP